MARPRGDAPDRRHRATAAAPDTSAPVAEPEAKHAADSVDTPLKLYSADLDGQVGQESIKQQVRIIMAQTRAQIAAATSACQTRQPNISCVHRPARHQQDHHRPHHRPPASTRRSAFSTADVVEVGPVRAHRPVPRAHRRPDQSQTRDEAMGGVLFIDGGVHPAHRSDSPTATRTAPRPSTPSSNGWRTTTATDSS